MDKANSGMNRKVGMQRGMPPQKAKDFKGTVKKLWEYMYGLKLRLLLVCGIVLLDAVLAVYIPLLIGSAVDAMADSGGVDFGLLANFVAVLGAVYLSDLVLIFTQGFIMAGVSQKFVTRLRTELFAKLQKLPLKFFDSHESGDIMSRLTNDMDTISGTVGQAAIQLATGVLTVSGTLAMMFALSPILACVVMLTVPLIYILTNIVTKRTGKLFHAQQQYLGELNSHIEESVTGRQTVRAFGREEQILLKFDKLNDKLCEIGTKANIWSGYIMPILNVINNFGFVLVSAVGGVIALYGMLTVGEIASFVSLSRQFVRPLNEIANTYNTFLSAIAGAERVFEILNENEEHSDGALTLEPAHAAACNVEFSDVTFGYTSEKSILKNVSFDVKPGMRAAFVGPTGAGKTTIINLLTRFYDVNGGAIKINGIDIRNYTRDSIRRTFGVVLQDTYLFGGTIRENIRYGRLEAADCEVERAAAAAGADHFITRLQNGYETEVTQGGSNLSAGQRQLLALARAVLCDPPILILDEATSSVDTRTELEIQKIMAKLMKNRTTFVIAHRLGTIRDADVIMVVDGGEICESGNHEQLMAKGGMYYKMYTSQMVGTAD